MLQRIRHWFVSSSPDKPFRMPPRPLPEPSVHERFPHKPETLPHVDGFKFRARLLDGRVYDGTVMVAGPARWLLIHDPSLPESHMRAETHSIEGWRHA